MENLYSNAILNLINAYSQRISKYTSALDKVNSLDETLFKGIVINKNHMVTKLSNIVNINIEILNILREMFTKENNMFTLNRGLVNKINEGLNSTIEGLKPTTEGLKPTIGGLNSINEGIELTDRVNTLTIDFLKEIAEVLGNSLYMPETKSGAFEEKSGEPPPPTLTPEEVKEKIIQSPGILRKPFIEYFKGKYKFEIIPIRLAFIMEDIYKNSKTSQMHIISAVRSTRTTVERAFSVLRKQGWIKLESSRQKEKFILTEKGKAFIEKIVNGL
ncbi:MAG: hypothetical protein ISS16_00355 [Ignavibacteria bacterium]|nr:hypothetical protein [Ignavibacteria bacterium]